MRYTAPNTIAAGHTPRRYPYRHICIVPSLSARQESEAAGGAQGDSEGMIAEDYVVEDVGKL